MSCLIQKPENTAAIANYIGRLLNLSYESNGMSCPESLGRTLESLNCADGRYFEESRIYEELVKLNHAAYMGRYPDKEEIEITPYKSNDISSRIEWERGELDKSGYYNHSHYSIKDWHYKIFKMIQFLIYQCEEDTTYSSDLLKGLKDLEKALSEFIVMNNEIYVKESWQ